MVLFKALAKITETRTIKSALQSLGSVNLGFETIETHLPCHIVREKHKGIAIPLPDGSAAGLFRCQQRWWVYKLHSGALKNIGSKHWASDYELIQFAQKPEELCPVWDPLALIREVASLTLTSELNALDQRLKKLGADSQSSLAWQAQAVDFAVSSSIKAMAGRPRVSKIGTKYIQGLEPENLYEKAFIQMLENHKTSLSAEGVRNEDVENYWNLPPLQREFVLGSENAVVGFLASRQMTSTNWASEQEMWEAISGWKKANLPIYGPSSTTEPTDLTGNEPLPLELHARIVEQLFEDLQKHQKAAKRYSSFNAYVRKLISKGAV